MCASYLLHKMSGEVAPKIPLEVKMNCMRASDRKYDLKRWSIPLKKPNEATKSELSQEGATGNTPKMMNVSEKLFEEQCLLLPFAAGTSVLCARSLKGKFIFSQSLLHNII